MKADIIQFVTNGDERGSLVALESKKTIPFDIKRVYYIYNNQGNLRRGFHAHINLKQVLICMHGSCKILLDDGKTQVTVKMDKPNEGLVINKMVWREMYDFSNDCVIMVIASEYYDENDYIRDYNTFKEIVKK